MNTKTLNDATVAELVAEDYRTAEIFKQYGIDFCCGGKKKIGQVCAEKNVNVGQLESELLFTMNMPKTGGHNFNEWSLSFLMDYIMNVHHTYINNNLSLIGQFTEKIAKVHGEHNKETTEINKLWKEVTDELTMHMKKEELVLFPYIKNLEKAILSGKSELPRSHFGTVKNPVRMMEQEHDLAGTLMHRIHALSDSFTPPGYTCNTYKVLYAKLKEFQDDLHTHIHLENNILFPRSVQMEDKIISVL